MRPLVVLLGIVMGSTVSIAVALLMTGVVFLLLPEYGAAPGGRAKSAADGLSALGVAGGRCRGEFLRRVASRVLAICGSRSAAGDVGAFPVDLLAKEMKRTRMNTFERLARHLVPAVLAGFAIGAAAAPKSGPIDEATYRAHIARLASDEFEGRKPGTDGGKAHARLPRIAVPRVGAQARQRRELPAGSAHGGDHRGPGCGARSSPRARTPWISSSARTWSSGPSARRPPSRWKPVPWCSSDTE